MNQTMKPPIDVAEAARQYRSIAKDGEWTIAYLLPPGKSWQVDNVTDACLDALFEEGAIVYTFLRENKPMMPQIYLDRSEWGSEVQP